MDLSMLSVTKFAARTIVSVGVGKIVNDIIANNVNDPEKAVTRVTTAAGAIVVGMMVKDASKAYVDSKIDGIVNSWNEAKQKNLEKKEAEDLTSSADPT